MTVALPQNKSGNQITGTFVGAVKDEQGKRFVLNRLWGTAFGGGTASNGALNDLFVIVREGIGPNELAGAFAKIGGRRFSLLLLLNLLKLEDR